MVLLVLGTTLALVLPIAQVPLLSFPFQFPVSIGLGYVQSKMIFHLLVRVGWVEPPHFHFVAPIL